MKSSMKNWRQNRMKQFWLHTLLRTYSSVMIIIIASFAILLSYADWDSREKEAQRVAQRVTARTVSEIEYYHRESTQIAQALVENQARIEGIYKYFSLSMPDYFYWQLERKASPYISVSLYENVDDLYVRNDFVTGVAIAFQDYKEVYVSTKDKRSGEKIRAEDFKPAGNSFAIPVSDPVSDQDLGVIYISLDPAVLYHAIDNTRGHTPMAVTVTSPFDTEIFHIGETVDKESENWLVGLTSHGYQVQVAVPKNFVLQGTVTSSALIVGLSLLFIVILYLTLRQTFANYQKQVVDLVESIQVIAQGEEGRRIDISEKDQELLLIAETTNDMLDRLEKNIHDIYQLELSQKDANMRALQAQINPHFMYNTLEFLRMYAVMQSQDELADIIYEFSSLLRNNISDERETLLKQELEFCRKYSYLCMVRYPKSIAYGFKIDPELENMKIPKFTLQPLVENYFAHGVDHRRTDNVISIKALKQDGFVEILVVDNGRGMSAEKLANIREKLSQRYFEHQASYSDQRQSIGIVNVHERFVLYFGDRYAITIESAEQAGVQYRITIQMVTEGLKRLIPFDKWDMEVVATASHADEALEYVQENPVDVIISDVNMPDKTGLDMIREMKEILPDAAYILLSGYQEFDYVKRAMNLSVVDYLVKPVDKVELGNLLEKIAGQLGERGKKSQTLSQELDEAGFVSYLEDKENWWIGLSKEKQGSFTIPYYVLGQDWQIFISGQPLDGLVVTPFEAPYQEHFERWKLNAEKTLFYGSVNLQQSESLFAYYEPIYRVIIQGNLNQIVEELNLLEKVVLENTPRVLITKQLFIQFVMDVFHLFEHLKADDLTDIVKTIHAIQSFDELVPYIKETLTSFFGQYRMNENVVSVLEVIGRDYQKELSLKDISKALFINPVYLGQLIKRETDSTFAELLNKQRIKAAQQLLLSTSDSIEDICYAVGYSNLGYFYKVFRKLCGKSPKAYRKQVETIL